MLTTRTQSVASTWSASLSGRSGRPGSPPPVPPSIPGSISRSAC